MSRFEVGLAPITWNNEDLKDLRPPVPHTTVLDEIRAAGYAGTELGDGFPRQPGELKRALAVRGWPCRPPGAAWRSWMARRTSSRRGDSAVW